MLGEVNLLYLGCKVVSLLDLTYRSRFWTSYEGWLGFQTPTKDGLMPAKGMEARCSLVTIMGARKGDAETLKE